MRCLHPRIIPNPSTKPNSPLYRSAVDRAGRYRDIRPYLHDTIEVPCGKCINCLRNRQNYMVSRVYAEAQKRGTFAFITLTYEDKYLPISATTYRVDCSTGECEHTSVERLSLKKYRKPKIKVRVRKVFEFKHDDPPEYKIVSKPEIVFCHRKGDVQVNQMFRSIQATDKARYIDVHFAGDGQYDYFVRYTPSVCREDVRLWLKRSRVRYEREFGEKLDFAYVAVSEMGPRTCRPHYHLGFLGLTEFQSHWLADQWKLGFVSCKIVNRVNEDGSDGFVRASKYIGKYMTKGKFECDSVKDGNAEKPRVCQSIGIGKDFISKLRDWMLCFDMYGSYDIESMFSPGLKRYLNKDEVNAIVSEIPRRLSFRISEKCVLPVPPAWKREIFKTVYPQDKTRSIPSTLWLLVTAHIRDESDSLRQEEFRQFCADHPEREMSENCFAFCEFREASARLASKSAEESYVNFLNCSVF